MDLSKILYSAPQISENIDPFLAICGAADQGEDSLVLVVVGGPFFIFPCTVFWGVKRKNFVSKGV